MSIYLQRQSQKPKRTKFVFGLLIIIFSVLAACGTPREIDTSNVSFMPEESAKQYLNKYLPSGWVDDPWFETGDVAGCDQEKLPGSISDIAVVRYINPDWIILVKKNSALTWCGRSLQIRGRNISEIDARNIFKALVSLGASEAVFKVL